MTAVRNRNPVRETLMPWAVMIALLASLLACACKPRGPASNSPQGSKLSPDTRKKTKTEPYRNGEVVAAQVLVKFRQPDKCRDRKYLDHLTENIAGKGVTAEPIGNGDVVMVRSSDGQSMDELRQKFTSKKYERLIEYVEPDYLIPLDCSGPIGSDDPFLAKQWGLKTINASSALSLGTGKDIVVAVIDSGIDCSHAGSTVACHQDLQGQVWLPPDNFSVRVGNQDVTCPTGCFGFDAIADDGEPDCKKWYPTDGNGHGTEVAGIIAAARDNSSGVVGVSYESKILAVRFAEMGRGMVSSLKRAIDFVIAASDQIKNLRVVNCSFGFDPDELGISPKDSQTIKHEFELLRDKKILVVASYADEQGTPTEKKPHYPATYNLCNIIAVTATTCEDQLVQKAQHDKDADNLIGAPGASIYTTCLYLTLGDLNLDHAYRPFSGTSFAAPFVAGAAAVVLSNTRDGCDGLSAVDLRRDILGTADSIDGLTKFIKGGRRLNVNNAVSGCKEYLH